ncbi:MAG: enoyl-CoA hydratase/isomerase family protein [Polaromonas sp.]|nr:enoyl-CoA hydratase/isomerase family protein [Polaromonas sp.]
MSGQVLIERAGGVATVTLSHAGKFNAMSRAMWRRLREVFLSLQADAYDGDAAQGGAMRCIILRGEGGHFCAGGDISEYAGFRFAEPSLRDFHENDVWGGLQAVFDCDLPVIAQIEGNCMGAGMEIASCCDIRIAGDSARFGAPIARLGFPMAPREAAVVVRAAGELTAREMLLEAAVLSAPVMLQRGFLNRLAGDRAVAAECETTAQRIALLAPAAARMNKQALRALQPSLPLPMVDAATYAYADTAEHREGIAAFIDKRKPRFSVP